MPNENCLYGIACPSCGQEDEFMIYASSWFTMKDDGSEDYQDIEHDDSAPIRCTTCQHAGTIAQFSPTKAAWPSRVRFTTSHYDHAKEIEDLYRKAKELEAMPGKGKLTPGPVHVHNPMKAFIERDLTANLDPAHWDAVEIMPVCQDDKGNVEACPGFHDKADGWSVYLHRRHEKDKVEEGPLQCVADFPTHEAADAFAALLSYVIGAAGGDKAAILHRQLGEALIENLI